MQKNEIVQKALLNNEFRLILEGYILSKTKEEAQQTAIAWQEWASDQSLSYGELAEWQNHFVQIAGRFNLVEEFKENGII